MENKVAIAIFVMALLLILGLVVYNYFKFQEVRTLTQNAEKILEFVAEKTQSPPSHIVPKNIDVEYLSGLPSEIIIELSKLTEGCPKNYIHNPRNGTCVFIESGYALKIIEDMKLKSGILSKPSPIDIDIKYLKNMISINSIKKLINLHEGCPHNMIRDPETHQCILITSKRAEELLA